MPAADVVVVAVAVGHHRWHLCGVHGGAAGHVIVSDSLAFASSISLLKAGHKVAALGVRPILRKKIHTAVRQKRPRAGALCTPTMRTTCA